MRRWIVLLFTAHFFVSVLSIAPSIAPSVDSQQAVVTYCVPTSDVTKQELDPSGPLEHALEDDTYDIPDSVTACGVLSVRNSIPLERNVTSVDHWPGFHLSRLDRPPRLN